MESNSLTVHLLTNTCCNIPTYPATPLVPFVPVNFHAGRFHPYGDARNRVRLANSPRVIPFMYPESNLLLNPRAV